MIDYNNNSSVYTDVQTSLFKDNHTNWEKDLLKRRKNIQKRKRQINKKRSSFIDSKPEPEPSIVTDPDTHNDMESKPKPKSKPDTNTLSETEPDTYEKKDIIEPFANQNEINSMLSIISIGTGLILLYYVIITYGLKKHVKDLKRSIIFIVYLSIISISYVINVFILKEMEHDNLEGIRLISFIAIFNFVFNYFIKTFSKWIIPFSNTIGLFFVQNLQFSKNITNVVNEMLNLTNTGITLKTDSNTEENKPIENVSKTDTDINLVRAVTNIYSDSSILINEFRYGKGYMTRDEIRSSIPRPFKNVKLSKFGIDLEDKRYKPSNTNVPNESYVTSPINSGNAMGMHIFSNSSSKKKNPDDSYMTMPESSNVTSTKNSNKNTKKKKTSSLLDGLLSNTLGFVDTGLKIITNKGGDGPNSPDTTKKIDFNNAMEEKIEKLQKAKIFMDTNDENFEKNKEELITLILKKENVSYFIWSVLIYILSVLTYYEIGKNT